MATVERSILINAPTDVIDEIALNASRLPEWYVGVEQATPDELYPEVDGKITLVYKAAGVTFNLVLTVQEWVRGDHITYHMTGMMIGSQRWGYTPEGADTRLTSEIVYEIPGGALGKIVGLVDGLVIAFRVDAVRIRNVDLDPIEQTHASHKRLELMEAIVPAAQNAKRQVDLTRRVK